MRFLFKKRVQTRGIGFDISITPTSVNLSVIFQSRENITKGYFANLGFDKYNNLSLFVKKDVDKDLYTLTSRGGKDNERSSIGFSFPKSQKEIVKNLTGLYKAIKVNEDNGITIYNLRKTDGNE